MALPSADNQLVEEKYTVAVAEKDKWEVPMVDVPEEEVVPAEHIDEKLVAAVVDTESVVNVPEEEVVPAEHIDEKLVAAVVDTESVVNVPEEEVVPAEHIDEKLVAAVVDTESVVDVPEEEVVPAEHIDEKLVAAVVDTESVVDVPEEEVVPAEHIDEKLVAAVVDTESVVDVPEEEVIPAEHIDEKLVAAVVDTESVVDVPEEEVVPAEHIDEKLVAAVVDTESVVDVPEEEVVPAEHIDEKLVAAVVDTESVVDVPEEEVVPAEHIDEKLVAAVVDTESVVDVPEEEVIPAEHIDEKLVAAVVDAKTESVVDVPEEEVIPAEHIDEKPVVAVVDAKTESVVDVPEEEVVPAEHIDEKLVAAVVDTESVVDVPEEEVIPAEHIDEKLVAAVVDTESVVDVPEEEVVPAEHIDEKLVAAVVDTESVVDVPEEEVIPAEHIDEKLVAAVVDTESVVDVPEEEVVPAEHIDEKLVAAVVDTESVVDVPEEEVIPAEHIDEKLVAAVVDTESVVDVPKEPIVPTQALGAKVRPVVAVESVEQQNKIENPVAQVTVNESTIHFVLEWDDLFKQLNADQAMKKVAKKGYGKLVGDFAGTIKTILDYTSEGRLSFEHCEKQLKKLWGDDFDGMKAAMLKAYQVHKMSEPKLAKISALLANDKNAKVSIVGAPDYFAILEAQKLLEEYVTNEQLQLFLAKDYKTSDLKNLTEIALREDKLLEDGKIVYIGGNKLLTGYKTKAEKISVNLKLSPNPLVTEIKRQLVKFNKDIDNKSKAPSDIAVNAGVKGDVGDKAAKLVKLAEKDTYCIVEWKDIFPHQSELLGNEGVKILAEAIKDASFLSFEDNESFYEQQVSKNKDKIEKILKETQVSNTTLGQCVTSLKILWCLDPNKITDKKFASALLEIYRISDENIKAIKELHKIVENNEHIKVLMVGSPTAIEYMSVAANTGLKAVVSKDSSFDLTLGRDEGTTDVKDLIKAALDKQDILDTDQIIQLGQQDLFGADDETIAPTSFVEVEGFDALVDELKSINDRILKGEVVHVEEGEEPAEIYEVHEEATSSGIFSKLSNGYHGLFNDSY
jgi:hypothetical protein